MQNRWHAVAPKPSSEKQDDESALDLKPNGDDVSWYNMGHGNRWVKSGMRAVILLSEWSDKSQ